MAYRYGSTFTVANLAMAAAVVASLSLGVARAQDRAAPTAPTSGSTGMPAAPPTAGTGVPPAGSTARPNGSTAPASSTAAPARSTAAIPSGSSETTTTQTGSSGAPPSSGTSLPPSVPSSAEAQQMQESAAYNVKLRDLERKVNELKEQVFRSKARLNLLKETVLHGVIAGARSAITFQNKMSGMYVPIRYSFALDGTEIFSKSDDSGKLGDQKEFEIYNGSITPGNHTLSVQLVYQGNAYGAFAYMKGYKFVAKSSHTFTATEGKQLQVKVVGFEKGNAVTTDPKDRPAVDFKESVSGDGKSEPKPNK